MLALASITATVWSLCGGLAAAEPGMHGRLSLDLGRITATMHEKGLRSRGDVLIEIDTREVARGFSRADCDGLLLIAPLPQTAQGWGHIAPRLDLSGFTVHYAYDGSLHSDVPQLQRLRDRLMVELRPTSDSNWPRLVAIAEAGNCNLVADVEAELVNFSSGKDESVPAIEDQWKLGG